MQHPTNDTITTNLPDPSLQGIHNFLQPHQLRFINDSSPKRIAEKSRQVEISPTVTHDLVHDA
jgi:phage FluMu gp28-like protein